MAERGATIQSVGPQNIAQATLGLKGGDVPQNILVPDLLGTVEVGRRSEPELLFEQDIVLWRSYVPAAAGGAGTFAQVELLNPKDVISVFWVAFAVAAVQEVNIVLGIPAAPALPNGAPILPCDTRVGRAALDAFVPAIRFGTRAAIIGANRLARLYNTTNFQPDSASWGPFIMGTADDQANENHFVIETAVANAPLELNLHGYSLPRRAR